MWTLTVVRDISAAIRHVIKEEENSRTKIPAVNNGNVRENSTAIWHVIGMRVNNGAKASHDPRTSLRHRTWRVHHLFHVRSKHVRRSGFHQSGCGGAANHPRIRGFAAATAARVHGVGVDRWQEILVHRRASKDAILHVGHVLCGGRHRRIAHGSSVTAGTTGHAIHTCCKIAKVALKIAENLLFTINGSRTKKGNHRTSSIRQHTPQLSLHLFSFLFYLFIFCFLFLCSWCVF